MKRKLLAVALAFCLVFNGMTVSGVHADSKLDKAKQELQDIRNQKSQEQTNLDQVKQQLDAYKQKMNELERQLYVQDQKVEQAKKDLQQAEKDLNTHSALFKQRVREIYIKGDMGYMQALFSANSISEFLTRFEVIRLIVKEDRVLLNQYFNAKEKKQQDEQALEAEENQLKEQQAKTNEEYQQIAALVKQHEDMLNKLNDEEDAKLQELDQIKSELSSGSGVWNGGLFSPPCDGPITSGYGPRVDPYTGKQSFHTGVDFGCPMGTPIHAAASGTVVQNRPSNGYGWIVMIDHGHGYATLYAHMYGNTVTVNVGDHVERGDKIAEVGNNGWSTGPHCHFEVWINGQRVNPMPYIQR